VWLNDEERDSLDYLKLTVTGLTRLSSNSEGRNYDNIYNFPNKSGTFALTSDIPDVSNKLDANGWTTNSHGDISFNDDSNAVLLSTSGLSMRESADYMAILDSNRVSGYAHDPTQGTSSFALTSHYIRVSNYDVDDNGTDTILAFPEASGTIAVTDDIPDISNKLDANGWVTTVPPENEEDLLGHTLKYINTAGSGVILSEHGEVKVYGVDESEFEDPNQESASLTPSGLIIHSREKRDDE
jgi:hypothetical protein